MTLNGWFQILLFLAAIAAVTVPGSIPCCVRSSA
jgi:hypothetical protein